MNDTARKALTRLRNLGGGAAASVAGTVFGLVPWTRRITAVMIVLGILAGLAELVGITFMISATFVMTGNAAQDVGGLGRLSATLADLGIALTPATTVLILTVAMAAKIVLSFANARLTTHVAQRISRATRDRIYDQLLDMSVPSLMQNDRGELITILATESYELANAHSLIVRAGVNFGTAVIFGLGLVAVAWQISAIVMVAGFIYSVWMLAYSRSYQRIGQKTSLALEQTMKLSWTSLQAVKAVRSFGIEEKTRNAFRSASADLSQSLAKAETYGHVTAALSEIIVFVVLLSIVASASLWQIPLPGIIGSIVILYRLQPQVREFFNNLLNLAKVEVPVRRIANLLDRSGKTYIARGATPVTTVRDAIEFRNVSYRYPGGARPILDDVSFSIPAGKRTAIVGASGSGKTTIVNLLLGLDGATDGQVLVDGVDLLSLHKGDWARIVATAGQDVELIEGSIRDNLQFYRDRPATAMTRAATLAGANEFIDSMPGGYDEWAGDEAMRLSGGQRQRLGLARALLDEPHVLVLDEATNGLDEDTENAVLHNIFGVSHGRTVIFVTHRRALLPHMHRVIELKADGSVLVTDQTPE